MAGCAAWAWSTSASYRWPAGRVGRRPFRRARRDDDAVRHLQASAHDGARARAGPRHQAALRAGRHARPLDLRRRRVRHREPPPLAGVRLDAERVVAEAARVLAPGVIYVFHDALPCIRADAGRHGPGPVGVQAALLTTVRALADALWEFGSVKVEARTLEHGHRTSDLVNACAKNGLLVDGLWEYSPSYDGGEPGSADEPERWLPAYLEIRARRVAMGRRAAPAAHRVRKRVGAARRSIRRTAPRSR